MIKAVINGERVECGKCGALLLKISNGYNENTKNSTSFIEIKCKHKSKGVCCQTINKVMI